MRLRITGGTVVTPGGRFAADVIAQDGVVAALAEPGHAGPADDELDAAGCLLFPGFIDPHVHSRDPGLTEKDDFAHSTLAALCGGVTTILDMPNTVPPLADALRFPDRAAQHARVASVDFGLWGMSLGAANLDQVRGLVEAGAVGVKLFWGYALDRVTGELVHDPAGRPPGDVIPPPGNADVFDLFREVAAAGGLLAAHCEDRGILDAALRDLGHAPRDYREFLASRPDAAEAAAIALAGEMARATGCRFHVLHVSSARGAQVVRRTRAEGIGISAETCPQYLTLTEADHGRLGSRLKVYPPVRMAADRDALWDAVRDGTIASIGSDHAPHTAQEKSRDLGAAPAGAIGVETMVRVLLGEMTEGRISPERLSWCLSEGTARLYGLFPKKGSIWPGSDCDVTIVEPDGEWRIDDAELHSKHRLSPWHGRTGRGRPRAAVIRGEVAMRQGQPVRGPRGMLVRPAAAPAGAALGAPSEASKLPVNANRLPPDREGELRELARDLVQAAYLRGDFLLSSGRRSSYYFDKYLFETKPAILSRLGRFLAELVPPETDRLAAPELGAVLLGGAVSLETGLPLVIVRKESKQHGTSREIEGELRPGERVTVIEDVVTTGVQAIRAARKLGDAGTVVCAVLAVLDREEGGGERIREAGLRYEPLFRRRQLPIQP